MHSDLKIQIVFAVFLAMELLGLFMIIIRTVANLEYAFNRTEDIINKEVTMSLRWIEQEKVSREKAQQPDGNRHQRNELLLNIPFMERLSKEKRKDGSA